MDYELRNIISGIGEIAETNLIQTSLFFIRESESTSGEIEKSELVSKENETTRENQTAITVCIKRNQLIN